MTPELTLRDYSDNHSVYSILGFSAGTFVFMSDLNN